MKAAVKEKKKKLYRWGGLIEIAKRDNTELEGHGENCSSAII